MNKYHQIAKKIVKVSRVKEKKMMTMMMMMMMMMKMIIIKMMITIHFPPPLNTSDTEVLESKLSLDVGSGPSLVGDVFDVALSSCVRFGCK